MSDRKALVIVDLVNDFVDGIFGSERAAATVVRTKRFLDRVGNSIPVFFTLDTHIENDPEFRVWGKHCLAGTRGCRQVDMLSGFEGYRVTKRHFDSFYDSDLDGLLRANGISTIYLTGISTDICVLHTAAGAFFRNYKTIVIEDLCSSIDAEQHERAIEQMARNYGTTITKSAEAEREIL